MPGVNLPKFFSNVKIVTRATQVFIKKKQKQLEIQVIDFTGFNKTGLNNMDKNTVTINKQTGKKKKN